MVRSRCLILAALAALTLALGGCSSAPAPSTPKDNDPEVWRPKKPVYPKPDEFRAPR